MRQSLRRRLLRQGVGLLCYLAGLSLFLLAVAGTALGGDGVRTRHGGAPRGERPVARGGRGAVTWTAGGGPDTVIRSVRSERDRDSTESQLRARGYEVASEETERGPRFVTDDGEVRLRCSECGTPNGPAHTYCERCSSRLSE